MSPTLYSILHVISVLVLTAYTFYAFAAPPETRKTVLKITGVWSLLALIGGFGLQSKLGYGFPGWLIVKVFCWLGLSALAGFGYRRRGSISTLMIVAGVFLITAVVMVYTKPF